MKCLTLLLYFPACVMTLRLATLSDISGKKEKDLFNANAMIMNKQDTPAKLGELVVATYCPDKLEWVQYVNCDMLDIYVYNKCPENKNHTGLQALKESKVKSCTAFTQLPNSGREGQTWLHHMLSHYDRLKQTNTFMLFLQGKKEYDANHNSKNGGARVNTLMERLSSAKS